VVLSSLRQASLQDLACLGRALRQSNGDALIVVRIKADAPVLRPDEPVFARPVL
jgi:hypothetical protein